MSAPASEGKAARLPVRDKSCRLPNFGVSVPERSVRVGVQEGVCTRRLCVEMSEERVVDHPEDST